ncbi:MAG: DUF2059 domain-containing protein [Alphaproteobacteria bacterium]|nr:DUF2059 domain-containing protein [Alphaproteobacteria bacterium]
MKHVIIAAVAALSFAASPVFAQEGDYEQRRALSAILAEMTGASGAMTQIIGLMVPVFEDQIRLSAPELTEAQVDDVTAIIAEEFEAAMPEFDALIVDLYAEEFTTAELQAAIDFYNTPAGRSMLERLPAISAAATARGEQLGVEVGQRAFPRIGAYLETIEK